MFCPKRGKLIAILEKIFSVLASQGRQGYIVGGFIRDWLLGRETNDIDIAVSDDAENIARQIAEEIKGKFVLLDDVNKTARVVVIEDSSEDKKSPQIEWRFDFSSFSRDIESDLNRRDFTINAMAVALKDFLPFAKVTIDSKKPTRISAGALLQLRLVDPFSGGKDLRDKIVRGLKEKIFEADPSRLLRAVRFAAELGFTIEPETELWIRCHSHLAAEIPGEKVREELLRLLNQRQASRYLRYLDKLGLLLVLIPELSDTKGVEQPTMHFWDVFEHSLQTVAALEFLVREGDWEYGDKDMLSDAPWSDNISAHLCQKVSSGSNHKTLLKLGGLLHDIAKPRTKSLDHTGRARFLGHTKQGAEMAQNILERLRFSNREIDLVKSLVYHHLRPVQMASEGLPTSRAIYRYFRDTADAGIDILILALADCLASRGPLASMEEWRSRCYLINYIITEHEKQQAKISVSKLVNGHDLMKTFGLSPGPLIGRLLALVKEAQASGEISTKEEALELLQRMFSFPTKQLATKKGQPIEN